MSYQFQRKLEKCAFRQLFSTKRVRFTQINKTLVSINKVQYFKTLPTLVVAHNSIPKSREYFIVLTLFICHVAVQSCKMWQ